MIGVRGRAARRGAMLGGALLALDAAAAMAQTAPDNGSALNEIVVTARKRNESLQQVPLSISAVSGNDLQRLGGTTFSDIGHLFPNVSFNDSNTQGGDFSIRGLTSGGSGSDTSIGLYVDDVFIGPESTIGERLIDLDTVQVLRGPQGTLFGRNTVAGAINITTRKPTDTQEVTLGAVLGNYGLYQVEATLNQPINDKVLTRTTFVRRARDGYLDNLDHGSAGNDEDGYSGRAHVLFKPGDRLQVLATVDASVDHTCDNMFKIIAGTLYTGNTNPDQSRWNGPCKNGRDIVGATLRADYQLESVKLSSISAYRYRSTKFVTDRDFTSVNVATSGLDTIENQFTQEFRATSPGGERLNWVAGVFVFDRSADNVTRLGLGPGLLGGNLSDNVVTDAKVDTLSVAAYGSLEYYLTPALSAELGLRYTYERKTLDYVQTATLPVPGFSSVPAFGKRVNGGELSPSFNLSYRWSPTMLTYLRIARGFKSGGFNAATSSDPNKIEFKPEYLTSYELGVKSELLDRRLRLNASVYYYDYTDIQQSSQTGAGFFISNAASARSYGAELEMNYRATRDLLLIASAGYANANYVDYGTMSGNRLPRAPRWTLSGSVDWTFASGSWGQAYLRPEIDFRTKNYVDNANTPLFVQQSHAVLNARIGIDSASNWSAGLWGRNLTDRRYTLGGFSLAPVGYYTTVAPPCTFGADFRVTF